MTKADEAPVGTGRTDLGPGGGLMTVQAVFKQHIWKLFLLPLAAGAAALGITFLVAPTFTARTVFLPPQQQQGITASMLNQLGALGALAGGAAGVKSPADQFVSLMQSATISDRIIDKFGLMAVYDAEYRQEARRKLAENAQISIGKKDGLITVEVDDHSAQRSAEIANQYLVELRRMASELALSEAKQRRVFFEEQLDQTRDRLAKAQLALQVSGFNSGALKAEPKAAAETYARLRAEATAAEVRLQTLRRSLSDNAQEVQQQQSLLSAMRSQLAKAEESGSHSNGAGNADYVGKYREFKYQETLFELYARQYELARADESRDGMLIQVIDHATPPERKSRPKRALTAVLATLLTAIALFAALLLHQRQAA